jgi:hypothetical protein
MFHLVGDVLLTILSDPGMSKTRDRVKRESAALPARSAPKRRRWWLKWVCRLVSLLVVGLIVAHWYWGRSASLALEGQIRVYALAGEPIEPGDLNDAAVADAENAVIDLRAAGKSLKVSGAEWGVFMRLTLRRPLSAKQMEVIDDVMLANREALRSLEKMAGKPGADWQIKFTSPVLEVKYDEPPHVLDLATLLRAGALYAHQQGSEGEALRRIKEMLALARVVDRERKLLAHVMAASIATLAARTAAEIAPELHLASPSYALASELIGEFLDDSPLRQGQVRALELTRVMFWDTCREVAGARTDLLYPAQGAGIVGGRVGCYALKPLMMNDVLWLVQYMTRMTIAAKFSTNWPEFCQNVPQIPAELVRNPRAHLMARSLLPDLSRYLLGHYRAITECRIAAVALAAGWSAQNHEGAMPASLEALRPEYLPYVPL